MNQQERSLHFLGLDVPDDAGPDFFRSYFLDYEASRWLAETNGGAFKVIDSEGGHHDLVIAHSADHGICLLLSKSKNFQFRTWVTRGDSSRMNEVIDVGSDEFFPVGAFVAPAEAWPIVSAYLLDPTGLPESPFLFPIAEVDWPEI